jgi:ADP-heptose:LPS heptosyltransferase
LDLVREIRRRRFDLVIDFHGFRETNLLAWSSGAKRRFGVKRVHGSHLGFCFNEPLVLEDKALHAAEMFKKVIEPLALAPISVITTLVIPEDLRRWAEDLMPPSAHRIAFYVDAPALDRVWPAESFAAVADYAMEKWNAQILVLSGNGGEERVRRVLRASRYSVRIQACSQLTIPQLAAVIRSCLLLVSNDTGPMHLGPAVGVPTIGLFSVGFPEHFRPTGPLDRFIRANPIEHIDVNEVVAAMESVWTSLDRDFRCLSSGSEGT